MAVARVAVRSVAAAAAAAAVRLGAVAGGEDDSATSSTTASSTTLPRTSSSTSTSSSVPSGVGSGAVATTTTPGSGDSAVIVRLSGAERSLTLQNCTSPNAATIDLTAQDSSGNTLTVKVANGAGSAVLRGSSEDREGAVKAVTIQSDGSFVLTGIMSVADDSAPGPDDLTITGLCSG